MNSKNQFLKQSNPLLSWTGSQSSPAVNQFAQQSPPVFYPVTPQTAIFYPSDWNDNTSIVYEPVVDHNTGHYSMSAMFGSHNAYGEHNTYNNNYGPNPYYSNVNNDALWINNCAPASASVADNNKPNRAVDYPEQDIANDSLYGYDDSYSGQSNLDGSIRSVESGLSGLSINPSRNPEEYGNSASLTIERSSKRTTWASIASQPAKSQPKSLKSKMAASGLTGSNSKHLPPTVTMESWESKNGSLGIASSGGKTIPPPTVISAPSVPPQIAPVAVSPIDDLQSSQVLQQQPPPPPPVSMPPPPSYQPPPLQVTRENSWSSNGNTSPSGSVANSDCSPRPSQTPTLPAPPMPRSKGPLSEHNGNYNQNNNTKYSNQRNNYSNSNDNQSYSAKNYAHSRDGGNSVSSVGSNDNLPAQLVLEKLCVENNYNPEEFDLVLRDGRFFIIKSYSEDDIHRSIKYSIWCSTEHGNKKLDNAFRQQEDKGPIYLFFSVNRSGHFCGVAQMLSHVDYNASSGVWSQDKWKGQFKVKWIYVKDVPNEELRHIKLENNENKPVTNSRDTQEVPYEKGKKVLSIIHSYANKTSIFDDFLHYEKKQEEELQRKPEISSSPPPNHYSRMGMPNSHYNSGMPRDNSMPYRGNNYNNRDHREYRDDFRNDHRGDFRGDYRNDRMDRNNYGRDHRDRNLDHRNDFRDGHHLSRDNRDFNRDYREPYNHRDNYNRDYNPAPPPLSQHREYSRDPRDRNDYRLPPPPSDHRDYHRENRDRLDYRERNHRIDDRHGSWRA